MEVNKILQADMLDIIFEGRNKEYGAYELRTNYRKRLSLALLWMIGLMGAMLMLYSFTNKPEKQAEVYNVKDHELEKIETEKPIETPPPVQPPPPEKQQVKVEQFVKPLITNEEVKPDEVPPTMDELEDAKIGKLDEDGDADEGIVAPPIDTKETGVIDIPKKKEDDADQIHLSVQIESEYPGGLNAWRRYLDRNLPKYYDGEVVENGIQGKVVVQFIVDAEGKVSEVRGIEGPKELWKIAEKVIMASGKWTPAVQNGRHVKSYKRQPITFRLEGE
ncbi:MAG TPA: energy transducer TonB [Chitinophagaceae bacterium]|nr:energy transducer TonB [Chitinophagaceae bacterium]